SPVYSRRTILVPAGGLPAITDPVIIDGTPAAGDSPRNNSRNYGIGNGTGLAPGFTLTKGTPGLVIDVGTVNGQTTTIRNLDIGPGSVPAFWSTTNSRIVLVGDASGFPGSGIIVTPRGRAIIVGNSRLGNGSSLANFNGGNGLAPGSYTTHNAVTGNL